MNQQLNQIVQEAIDAFWHTIATNYPQIKTGDLDPMTVVRFDQYCRQVVAEWLYSNSTGGRP